MRELPELTREDFRQWLVDHEPDTVVGTRRDPWGCPLATWIRARTGVAVVEVGGVRGPAITAAWRADDGTYHQRVLRWALPFARAVDQAPAVDEVAFTRNGRVVMDITAKEALTILDSLEVAS